MKNYIDYIEINSQKRFGKPCIKGTRISVFDVLNWFANGMTRLDIKNEFPELTDEMINACLSYAANRENKVRIAS